MHVHTLCVHSQLQGEEEFYLSNLCILLDYLVLHK